MPDVLVGRDASFASHLGDGHIDDGNEVGDEANAVGDRSERAAGMRGSSAMEVSRDSVDRSLARDGDESFHWKDVGGSTYGCKPPRWSGTWSQTAPAVQFDSATCSLGVQAGPLSPPVLLQPLYRFTRCITVCQSHVGLLATSRQSMIMPTCAGPPSNRSAAGSVKIDRNGGTNAASRM